MNHVIWTLPNGSQLPMIKSDDGTTLILPRAAAGALGCSHAALSRQIRRHAKRLSKISRTDCPAKEFLRQNKEVFGVLRVKEDMRLLTDAEFLYLAAHTETEQARGLHQSYIRFIIDQTRKDMVTRDEYYTVQARLFEAEDRLMAAAPFVRKSASLAGSLLHAQRGTKSIRSMN